MPNWEQLQLKQKEDQERENKIVTGIHVGQWVYYHSIINDPHDGVPRQIESDPWQLGHGAWVVKVTGKSGGVSVRALTFMEQHQIDAQELLEMKQQIDSLSDDLWFTLLNRVKVRWPDDKKSQWLMAGRVMNRLFVQFYLPCLDSINNNEVKVLNSQLMGVNNGKIKGEDLTEKNVTEAEEKTQTTANIQQV